MLSTMVANGCSEDSKPLLWDAYFTSLKELEEILKLLSKNVRNENVINGNLEFIKDLGRKGTPELLIKEILASEELLAEVAARSYEHVNYFDKIVLIDNKDPSQYRLTLHSWNGVADKMAADVEEELIHNHRFSFWSYIFRGTLLSENFIESDAHSIEKRTFNKFIYRPTQTGNVHECTFDTKVQLNKIENTSISQGNAYYLNFNTTHRVILPKTETNLCTFVLRGPREREYTNTYNTFYPDAGIKSSVPMMKPEQLKIKLLKILGENV